MSTLELTRELAALPAAQRLDVLRDTLHRLYPDAGATVDRLLRRLENPDVPEEFWEGLEQAEDGKAVEIHDAHFERPPV